MSLLDSDLMEKIDVPMIFEAINKLKKVMDDNLDKIVEHEKEISDLYKNVIIDDTIINSIRFELKLSKINGFQK